METDEQNRIRLLYGDVNTRINTNGSPTHNNNGLTVDSQGNKYTNHNSSSSSNNVGRRGDHPRLIQQQAPNNFTLPHYLSSPPPGLSSSPANSNNNNTPHHQQYFDYSSSLPPPPGFFFPSQQPQQQNLYGIPQFGTQVQGSPSSSPMYSLHQHHHHHPSYNPYNHPFYIPPPNHLESSNLNTNIVNDNKKSSNLDEHVGRLGGGGIEEYELSQKLNMLLQTKHQQQHVGSSGNISPVDNNINIGLGSGFSTNNNINNKLPSASSSVLPVIENIVGSMSMSTNGSYTHFGPSKPTVSPVNVGHVKPLNQVVSSSSSNNNNSNNNSVQRQEIIGGGSNKKMSSSSSFLPFVQSPMNNNTTNITTNSNTNTLNKSTGLLYSNDMKIIQQNGKDKMGIVHPRVIVLEKENQGGGIEKVTPQEIQSQTDSRPQTPGKLSYSEVLSKTQGVQNSAFQKVSSNSTVAGHNGQLTNRRTSTHSLQGDFISMNYSTIVSSNIAPTNSSSSESSPKTKPKLPSNSTNNNNTAKNINNKGGKENSNSSHSNPSSKPSTTKTTPNTTPTHSVGNSTQQQQNIGKSGKSDRKILSSNILNGSSSSSSVSNGSVGKNANSSQKGTVNNGKNSSKIFQLEFDNDDKPDLNTSGSSNKSSSSSSAASTTSLSGKKGIANNVTTNGGKCTTGKVYNGVNGLVANNLNENKKTGGSSSSSSLTNGNSGSGSLSSLNLKRNKDKPEKSKRKEDRNRLVLRVRLFIWHHLISLLMQGANWLGELVVNVSTLSFSLAFTLLEDFYTWSRSSGIPSMKMQVLHWRKIITNLWHKAKLKLPWFKGEGDEKEKESSNFSSFGQRGNLQAEELLKSLGPEKNIILPNSGEEAMKRLLSCKDQDPYSILGIRSDSSDETIRRYYKKQAVLVHPDKNLTTGSEEAFKILARAFELVGEPAKRVEYHTKLVENFEKERVFGEIGNLLEQLRKKMESVTNTIRCTKCNSRHRRSKTDRPLFSARYCSTCRIRHGAREGDLWAEKRFFGLSYVYYACMENSVWEVNDWAQCHRKNLKDLVPNCHNIKYRLISGGNNMNANKSNKGSKQQQQPAGSSENSSGFDNFDLNGGGCFVDPLDPEDDWDTLINNLTSGGATKSSSSPSHHHHDDAGGGGNTTSTTRRRGKDGKAKRK